MAASNIDGSCKYWLDGIPIAGKLKAATSTSGVKYWIDGIPYIAKHGASGGGGGTPAPFNALTVTP